MKVAAWLLASALVLAAQEATPPVATCYVAGQVLNAATGEPVRKAKLTLIPTGDLSAGEASIYTTTSDERGRFAMKDILPGKYTFAAERAGFMRMEYGARRPGHNGITLSLDAGQQLTGLIFRLQPHAVIAGHILDEDGEPVEGARVETVRYRYLNGKRQLMPGGSATTDDLGEYRLFGLAPGRYYLSATLWGTSIPLPPPAASTARKTDERGYVPTYYPGSTDIRNATPVELSPGTQLRGMDFSLSKTRTLHVRGRVSNPAGPGRQMLIVTLMPRGASVFSFALMRRARTDPEGKFELTNLPPGSYVVSVMSRGEVAYSAREGVDLTSSNIDDLVLTLSAAGTVSGQVRCEGPCPANRAQLNVHLIDRDGVQMMGPPPMGSVEEDLSFTISNAGTYNYDVRMNGLPDGYYMKSVRLGDDEVRDSGIDCTHGIAGPLVITISARAGQIEGVALNGEHKPVAAATVVLVPNARRRERAFQEQTTDQYGRFVLKSIEPGKYKLFAWEDMESGEYMDPEFLKSVESRGQAIEIREGARETAEVQVISASAPAPKLRKQGN